MSLEKFGGGIHISLNRRLCGERRSAFDETKYNTFVLRGQSATEQVGATMEGGGQHRQPGDPLSSPGMGQSSTAVAGQRQKTEAGNWAECKVYNLDPWENRRVPRATQRLKRCSSALYTIVRPQNWPQVLPWKCFQVLVP